MDYLNLNVFSGMNVRPQWLLNWANSNIQHVDYNDKNLIIASYTTYGALTGLGNVLPLCFSIVDTDYFRNDLCRKHSVSALLTTTKHTSLSHGIMAYYALLLQYCAIEENLDEHLKAFTKISPKQLRVNQRGSVVTFNDLAAKIQTSSTYQSDIHRVLQSIRQHYIP